MYAHSPNPTGAWHELKAHLEGTADRAARFASPFGGAPAARAIGLWHDLGKANPEWQAYLDRSARGLARRGSGPEHKLAGALLAAKHPYLQAFALAIAGHHGGMPSLSELTQQRLVDEQDRPVAEESLRLARTLIPNLEQEIAADEAIPPAVQAGGPRACEHFVRMVFSALVDADFLDTEAHFDAGRVAARGTSSATPEALLALLIADQTRRFGDATGDVADARRLIFKACLAAASHPPGMFRLSVPTGGGKTRAGMAFALAHAARHGQRRVIVAIPFVSITEQTAAVYREIFSGAGIDTVLEHHSAFDEDSDREDAGIGLTWSRLAAENWDAPIVVTTTVQLLESLFSNRPSRARKLHNIAGSVVILDEAQSLPPNLLDPTLEMLRDLTRHYGVTVVLSTATQPAFEVIPAFRDVEATEIVPDPGRWYRALERVEYEARLDRRQERGEVAAWLRGEHQALAIVNRKSDAIALLDALEALGGPQPLHLSTLLCGLHRRRVIDDVRRRLGAKEPCIVVSTQVVEAGVDLDFPAVYRAVGPLDAIVQAAGRCNREGNRPTGRVVIFDPAEGGGPGGAYDKATQVARQFLDEPGARPDGIETLQRYYERYLTLVPSDLRAIQARRDAFDYPEVAQRYRLIDEDTEPVVITSYGTDDEQAEVRALLDDARSRRGNARRTLRALQRYVVSVRRREAARFRARGLIEEVAPGLHEWRGEYDEVRGILTDVPDHVV